MNFSENLNAFRILGFSGSGKTTLACDLISHLKEKGFQPAYFKHSGHTHSFDQQGKDTRKAMEAGVVFSSVSGKSSSAFFSDIPCDSVFFPFLKNQDILVIEGFSNQCTHFPALVLKHPEKGMPEGIENLTAYVVRDKNSSDELRNPPVFCADETDKISDFLIKKLTDSRLKKSSLLPAILIGGESKRMGSSKAFLDYGGKAAYTRLFDMLEKIFVESELLILGKNEQREFLQEAHKPHFIQDIYEDKGPFGGLLTALEKNPGKSVALFGCDYPLLNEETVKFLIEHREPLKCCTLFQSENGWLETVCGIYEPVFHQKFFARLLSNPMQKNQEFLANLPHKSIPIPTELRNCLKSIDTPDEYERIKRLLHD